MSSYLQFERTKWDQYFEQALAGKGQEHDNSLWWKIPETDTLKIITDIIKTTTGISVLEAGCGSGRSSFLLANNIPIKYLRLSDISENALKFAKKCQPIGFDGTVEYKKESSFNLNIQTGKFDLTWNIGVIEHYPLNELLSMINEMLRVTNIGGYVIVAIPNRNSIAVLKAWLLGTKFGRQYFRFVSGYRFDTETLYGNNELAYEIYKHFDLSAQIKFAGSLLWVSAPNWLVKLVNKYFPRSRFSFLTFFIMRKLK
jgi:2-polyprenyl-3-methyl-5-hydroxy-6-metoxy-1,4-benzoquinol methylase